MPPCPPLPRARRRAPRPMLGRLGRATAVAATLCATPDGAVAQPRLSDTQLLDVRLGSARSEAVAGVRHGGYELADGTRITFEGWYSRRWPDLDIRFLTPLAPDLAMTWGLSTGERGAKYRIDPALRVGLVYRRRLDAARTLSVSMTTVLGGDLRERPCTADFGAIGGVQRVNCRLAASTLRPADTLRFLMRKRGHRESRLSISYVLRF